MCAIMQELLMGPASNCRSKPAIGRIDLVLCFGVLFWWNLLVLFCSGLVEASSDSSFVHLAANGSFLEPGVVLAVCVIFDVMLVSLVFSIIETQSSIGLVILLL